VTPRPSPRTERSYRALLTVPGLGRILTSMMFARIAQAMVGVALVLFTLDEYGSPALTGIVTAASVLPGLLIAPIAGALLDRQGRTKLVMLDYAVALLSLVLIGGLAHLDALPVPLLLAITIVSSLTSILSQTGLRSLFPLLVPERLWERVNAIDSNGYLVATIIGPPLAAALVTLFGGAVALILIGLVFGAAMIAMIGAPDPDTSASSTGSLLADAWAGIRYTFGNATLRGLGLSISLLNLSGGMTTIVVPLVVLDRLGYSGIVVGLAFAASGVAGMVAALLAGRLDTRGREWDLLVLPMGGIAVADLLCSGFLPRTPAG
jgi:MFS family permease